MTTAFARSARRVIQGCAFGEDAVLVRQTPGRFVRGRFQAGTPTETAIRLVSAPLTSRDMAEVRQVLPEGARLRKARKFWIATTDGDAVAALRVGEGRATGPDVIRYRGAEHEVIYVSDYSEHGFTEVVATRPDREAAS